MKKGNPKKGTKQDSLKISAVIHREDCMPKPLKLRNNYYKEKDSIIIPEQVNEHQQEMDKIANEMAVLFEEKITVSDFAKWLVIAKDYQDSYDDLIWNLGYNVLPGLIDAKTKDDRINFLKKQLPEAFEIYKFARASLFQLCENYFKENKNCSFFIEPIKEFMNVCLTLLAVCEKFESYEYEEIKKDKAA